MVDDGRNLRIYHRRKTRKKGSTGPDDRSEKHRTNPVVKGCIDDVLRKTDVTQQLDVVDGWGHQSSPSLPPPRTHVALRARPILWWCQWFEGLISLAWWQTTLEIVCVYSCCCRTAHARETSLFKITISPTDDAPALINDPHIDIIYTHTRFTCF